MTCEEAGCYEAAIISIRKDPFGKSDAMRHLCSHHAPRWLAVSGQVNEKAIGGSDVCHTCAAHVKVITEDLEPRIGALEAELAVEKMQHSVTIADEHESRSEFQDRIRALEAERDDVVEARGEMARENVRLATELTEWRELYEFGLKDRNELLARAQTAEAYAARNALRVIEVEAVADQRIDKIAVLAAALTKVHGIIAEYWGPCMGSIESLATIRDAIGPDAAKWGPKLPQTEPLVDLKNPHNAHHPDRLKGPGLTAKETACEHHWMPATQDGSLAIIGRGCSKCGAWETACVCGANDYLPAEVAHTTECLAKMKGEQG